VEGKTKNTTERGASQELSRNGRIVFDYASLKAGEQLTVWIQYQVNPTTVGSRTQHLELDDGNTPVATIARKLTVLP
jgi:hypothetical protein